MYKHILEFQVLVVNVVLMQIIYGITQAAYSSIQDLPLFDIDRLIQEYGKVHICNGFGKDIDVVKIGIASEKLYRNAGVALDA